MVSNIRVICQFLYYERYVYTISHKVELFHFGGCHGRDGMVIGFTPTCGISVSHHFCEFEPSSCWCVLHTTVYDKVCQRLSPGIPTSSTNKNVPHNITGIMLIVALTSKTSQPCCSTITEGKKFVETALIKTPQNYDVSQKCIV